MRKITQCVALVLIAAPSVARADFFLHPWENHHEKSDTLRIAADASYFSTSSNYDSTGMLMSPAGLNKYTRAETDGTLTYGFSERISLYARMAWVMVNLDSTTRPGTSYGLADQSLGLNYRLYEGDKTGFLSSIHLQAQVDLPGYSNAASDSNLTPWFGDQSIDTTVGAFATGRVLENNHAELLLIGGAGYAYRTGGFSSAVPWSASLKYAPRVSGFTAAFTGYGSVSMQTDVRTGNTALMNSSSVSPGTGGSFIAGGINPSFASVRGTVGYETRGHLLLTASMMQTVSGQSAPSGMLLAGGLEMRFGGGAKSRGENEEYTKSNQGFIDYTFEAKVLKNSGQMNQIRIDKGTEDGVSIGQTFDVFNVNTDGSLGQPVARAKVSAIKGNEAALTVVEYFKEVWIEEGFIAKRPLQ